METLSKHTCLKSSNWFFLIRKGTTARVQKPRPHSSSTYSSIYLSKIHCSKGQSNLAFSYKEWLVGVKKARVEFWDWTEDVRARGSDKKDFPLCSRTARKTEGYFSRHVSGSLGQNINRCKAIRLQKIYLGLNLSSVCLRQGENCSFEESKLEVYSFLSISSSTVVPFSLR